MFPLNHLVVAARIDSLLAESAAERLARSTKTTSPSSNRIAGAIKGVWSVLNEAAKRPTVLPRLNDYPFRS